MRVLIYLETKNSYTLLNMYNYIYIIAYRLWYDITSYNTYGWVYTILRVVSSIVCAWSIILFISIIRPCFFKNAAAPNTPMNNANEPVGRRTRFINHTHVVYRYIYGRRRVLTADAVGPSFILYIYYILR